MSLDDIWHIVHATVADFNCIEVENFVKLVASWEMFRYQLKYLLCLYEKLEIVTYQNQKEHLNKRSELLCKCRHASKFVLKNYTGNDF